MKKEKNLQNLIDGIIEEFDDLFRADLDKWDKPAVREWIKKNLLKIAKATAEAGRVEKLHPYTFPANYFLGMKTENIAVDRFNQAIQEQQRKLKEFFKGLNL